MAALFACPGNYPIIHSLASAGIETLIHYPVPLNEQPAFSANRSHECPVASRATRELLSLPLHPGLSDDDVRRVIAAVANVERRNVLA